MFRNLCMLRRNILLSRIVYPRCTLRANVATTSKLPAKATDFLNNGISVSEINICDLAKGDLEFTRNFLTSLPSLEANAFACATAASNPTGEPEVDVVPENPDSSGIDVGSGVSSVLDRDGQPIVAIEIDGWKNANQDDDDQTVQNSTQHIEIGNDAEYKAENMLVVPETREGQFEYKGIKVKLPENASKDIGTYRFRRDQEDFETVADDMRVVKFDKK